MIDVSPEFFGKLPQIPFHEKKKKKAIYWSGRKEYSLLKIVFIYVARVRFGIRVRVRVRDSAIFEKDGCGCGGTQRLKNIFIYIFNILLSIFFHIIQTYTKFKSNSEVKRETKQRGREAESTLAQGQSE